ncbi:hypothetical protein K458DRAFT_444043 [Lentithecium fluviatile CBS 122367]|uniref:Glutamine amidotransferase domain-containing protein n=1 Tax=Lentithecium fluviatile CBS 122367 TaxID=1168545 RepID=A0A6G1IWS0_9PLEO|nr:hypothetical protein K458DRAFT_444043 [Lentithecium fluviatile CBS 122367]
MAPPEAHTVVSDHPEKVRMLVLETDEPHPDTQAKRDSFGEVLHDLLKRAGDEHDPTLGEETVMQYVVERNGGKIPQTEEITDDIHAILATESVYNAHSDEAWIHKIMDFIKHTFTGICFSHQILCRVPGSKVKPNADGEWELSHTAITLTDTGRSFFELLATEQKIHLHQMYVDHVVCPPIVEKTSLLEPATKIHMWGSGDRAGVRGVYVARRLFSTQGHIEFNAAIVKKQLELRVKSGPLTEKDADGATYGLNECTTGS